jgi:hypothetical protein
VSAPRRARPRSRATKRAYCRRHRPVDAPDTRRQSPVQQGTVTVAGRGAGTQHNIFLLPRASPSVGLGVWVSQILWPLAHTPHTKMGWCGRSAPIPSKKYAVLVCSIASSRVRTATDYAVFAIGCTVGKNIIT